MLHKKTYLVFRFSQASFESQASELQTYRRKTEFNAKWPIKVTQRHVFWSEWKSDQGLSNTNIGLICWGSNDIALATFRPRIRNILRNMVHFLTSLLVTSCSKVFYKELYDRQWPEWQKTDKHCQTDSAYKVQIQNYITSSQLHNTK